MKYLIFTTDLPPLNGHPTSGTALRTWGLGQGLKSQGHTVVYSPPRPAVELFTRKLDRNSPYLKKGSSEFEILQELRSKAFDPDNQSQIVESESPDIILCGHWPAMMLKRKPLQPLIIDLAGPHLLERHFQKASEQSSAVLVKLGILASADLFIVSGPSQRRYFRSYLERAGIENIDERCISIPMPLDPAKNYPRNATAANYPHFLFAGVFLPWQDPSHALSFTAEEIARRGQGKLTLVGGKHPHYDVSNQNYERLFKSLQKNPFVEVKPLMPYSELQALQEEADVALDLMNWNIERQLAVTIRTTTYLRGGLPVIYNDYADLGRWIKEFDAGWAVPPLDENALRAVFEEIYNDRDSLTRKSANASRLSNEIFSWDEAGRLISGRISILETIPRSYVDVLIDAPELADLHLGPQRALHQQFGSRFDGLSQIDLRIATHGKIAKSTLTLELRDSDQRRTVAHQNFEPQQLIDNEWINFRFSPLKNSAGREFILSARCDDEQISLWAARFQPYPMGICSLNGRKLRSLALCMRTSGELPYRRLAT